MVTPTAPEWTRPRLVLLSRHAAASELTPEEALDALLALPTLRTGNRRRWTEAELTMLRNPRNHPRDIAKQTGRSVASVSARRSQLARDESISALQNKRRRKHV